MQKEPISDLTPLTVDPELKRKWNRLLALEEAISKKSESLEAKQVEYANLKKELGVD